MAMANGPTTRKLGENISTPIRRKDFIIVDAQVLRIKPEETYDWILNKHYAKRLPNIMYAFGLFIEKYMIGVVTYGITPCFNLNNIAGQKAIELNRLCINDNAKKNSASLLISKSLKMLDKPCVVISYSDTDMSHVGYIYQATNWIYTGTGGGDIEFKKNGITYHRKAIFGLYGTGSKDEAIKNGYEPIYVGKKHRYLYLLGTRKQKKEMLANIQWPILPYPKGETKRYDASHKAIVQMRMF
jgi:hypothetical protein